MRNLKLLTHSQTWVSKKEAAMLLGITRQSMQLRIKKKKCESVKTDKGYQILLSSLGREAETKYYNIASDKEEVFASKKITENDLMELALEKYEKAPEYNRKRFDKYITILKECEGLAGKELKNFVNIWNAEHPDRKTSYARVLSARKLFNEEGPESLFGKWGNRLGDTKINQYHYEYFEKMYLDEEQQSAKACWIATLGYAREIDKTIEPSEFPSANTFLNLLKKKNPADIIDLKRKGAAYYKRHWQNYIERDYSNLKPGEVWVSDHRQLDQAVIDEIEKRNFRMQPGEWFSRNLNAFLSIDKSKKPIFPWITVWRDLLTGKWLGWYLHLDAPDTDDILHAFYLAATKYGIPDTILIDNGKDYRSKDFAGGRISKYKLNADEVKIRSLTSMLNIKVIFAIPYNAQAKPIERDFKIYKEWMDKKFPGYRGGNVVERPEKLLGEIKTGKLVKFNKYIPLMNFFIEEVLHKYKSEGKVLQGRSRNKAWIDETKYFENNGDSPALRKVADDDLKLFCMRMSNDQVIKRNGITLSQKHKLYYWGDWMSGMKGEYVYMRRSNIKYQEAWVFRSSDDTYLGKAMLNVYDSPVLIKNDLDKKVFEEVIHRKNQSLKIAKMLGVNDLQISAQEELKHHAMGISALSDDDADNTGNTIKLPSKNESNIFVLTKLSEAVANEKRKAVGDDYIIEPLNSNLIEDEEDWV